MAAPKPVAPSAEKKAPVAMKVKSKVTGLEHEVSKTYYEANKERLTIVK